MECKVVYCAGCGETAETVLHEGGVDIPLCLWCMEAHREPVRRWKKVAKAMAWPTIKVVVSCVSPVTGLVMQATEIVVRASLAKEDGGL